MQVNIYRATSVEEGADLASAIFRMLESKSTESALELISQALALLCDEGIVDVKAMGNALDLGRVVQSFS